MKIIGLVAVSFAWAMSCVALKAEAMKLELAQSSTIPQLPKPASPPVSQPIVPLPLPQRPTIPLAPLNKYLFDSLWDLVRESATTELVAATDQAFQSIWQQAFALEENSPQFSSQVLNLLQSLAPIQQQYQASGDRWGELKMLEVSLKLHYLTCQDERTLSIAQQGVAMAAATGDWYVKTQWSNILSQIYRAMGEANKAIETQQQMLDSLRTPDGNLTFFEAYELVELGKLYRSVGRYDEAIAAYVEAVESADRPPLERSLDVYYAAGHTFKQSAIEELISLHEPLGNAKQVEYWIQQREQAKHVYEQLSRASDLLWSHLIEEGTEKMSPAQRKLMVEEALQIYRQLDYPWGESDALVALSEINLALQDYSQAIAAGEAALEMVRTLKDSRNQESLVQTLVQAYLAAGQDNQAQAIWKNYEQYQARQGSSSRSRPRFSYYGFAMGANSEMLPVLHEERRCFGEL
ncbi:MAG: tetratricopeptide repeat protein [Microcoleus vaginatus WJT46-NPBG5]|jgi:tetratricopeptide (TPR) repeat protein|nr:tetratricopeptide repeat protein [Microcoleus vaginatus WJT46-NPBG5]